MTRALAGHPGDLLLLVADREPVAATALGELRLELARRFGLVPEGRHDVLWVVDFPMFEWNEGEGRWDALHHPVHGADRLVRGPGRAALARLRHRAGRLGARRRLHPHQPPRGPAAGVHRAGHLRGGGGRALRLPARRAALRRAAARRDRARHRPAGGAARRARLDPRRDGLPQDGERLRPAHGRAGAGGPRRSSRSWASRSRAAAARAESGRPVAAPYGQAGYRGGPRSADGGEAMSQISPPIRILLVGFLALLAAWMLFLRPKAETVAPTAGRDRHVPAGRGGRRDGAERRRPGRRAGQRRGRRRGRRPPPRRGPSAAAKTAAAPPPRRARPDGEDQGRPTRARPARARRRGHRGRQGRSSCSSGRAGRPTTAPCAPSWPRSNRHGGKVVVHAAPMKRFGRYPADHPRRHRRAVPDRGGRGPRAQGRDAGRLRRPRVDRPARHGRAAHLLSEFRRAQAAAPTGASQSMRWP